jgi:hypothetical protein
VKKLVSAWSSTANDLNWKARRLESDNYHREAQVVWSLASTIEVAIETRPLDEEVDIDLTDQAIDMAMRIDD